MPLISNYSFTDRYNNLAFKKKCNMQYNKLVNSF